MTKEIEVGGEKFTVSEGKDKCTLEVTDGNDMRVISIDDAGNIDGIPWRGEGAAKALHAAVSIAAQDIIRKKGACEAMQQYLKT